MVSTSFGVEVGPVVGLTLDLEDISGMGLDEPELPGLVSGICTSEKTWFSGPRQLRAAAAVASTAKDVRVLDEALMRLGILFRETRRSTSICKEQ